MLRCGAITLLLLGACGEVSADLPIKPVGAMAITQGSHTSADPAVVALLERDLLCGDQTTSGFCTGTLIEPDVVLTAAHCVDGREAETLAVFFGNDVAGSGERVPVARIEVHPAWDRNQTRNDIALLLLDRPVDHAPVPLFEASLDEDLVGGEVRVVGFGAPERGASGSIGDKRQGTATLTSFTADEFRIDASPSMTCGGDSGGPVLLAVGDTEYLLGVTSWGDPECEVYAVNTRVDFHRDDFILGLVDDLGLDPRGPIDPTEAFCEDTCEVDADCPWRMTCSDSGDGNSRCAYGGFDPGSFDAECTSSRDCGSGVCLSAPLENASCQCYLPCSVPTDSPASEPSSGCAVAGARNPGGILWLLVLVLATRRRRT